MDIIEVIDPKAKGGKNNASKTKFSELASKFGRNAQPYLTPTQSSVSSVTSKSVLSTSLKSYWNKVKSTSPTNTSPDDKDGLENAKPYTENSTETLMAISKLQEDQLPSLIILGK